jgi:hypothetical protein
MAKIAAETLVERLADWGVATVFGRPGDGINKGLDYRAVDALHRTGGGGEVNEEVVGTGLRHAIGALVTCPFCIGQRVASGLVAGMAALPETAEAFATVDAPARVSDYLQLAYDQLKSNA